ncbi:MAG: hypothetical protein BRD45_06365 [Bacteroidetes bacterium QS_8_64_10]|nr:MAG: hypothetical protein BRD45_06365 [Bacteroidetes bacterium QS_8_64_10]
MNGNPFTFKLTPAAFWRWGRVALAGALVFMLALVLMLAWKAPMGLLAVPVLLLAGVAVWWLVQRPLVHLCVVLGGGVAFFVQSSGVSALEVLYVLYLLGYLVGWFAYHGLISEKRILRTPADKALVLFTAYATFTLGFSVLYGADPASAIRVWLPVTIWGMYFPIKKACRLDGTKAMKALLATFALLAFVVAVRNFHMYYKGLQNAEIMGEIIMGRAKTNERALTLGTLGSLVYLLHARRVVSGILFGAMFAFFVAGVVVTRSRSIWLAALLGMAVVFVLVNRRMKARMLLAVVGGSIVVLVAGEVALDNFFGLVFDKITSRFLGIGEALTSDLSMINRFYEWQSVWEYIKVNPLLGYGPGVEFEHFNLILNATQVKTQIHNGYLQMWYQYGLVGLGLLLFTFVYNFRQGLRLLRQTATARTTRLVSLFGAASLLALALASTTESMRYDDTIVELCFPLALLAGAWQHHYHRPG